MTSILQRQDNFCNPRGRLHPPYNVHVLRSVVACHFRPPPFKSVRKLRTYSILPVLFMHVTFLPYSTFVPKLESKKLRAGVLCKPPPTVSFVADRGEDALKQDVTFKSRKPHPLSVHQLITVVGMPFTYNAKKENTPTTCGNFNCKSCCGACGAGRHILLYSRSLQYGCLCFIVYFNTVYP